MSPIKEGTNREKNAINAVVAENGHQDIPKTPNNSRKKTLPVKESWHRFFNHLTGFEVQYPSSKMILLASGYVNWVRQQTKLPLKQTYWLQNGMEWQTVYDLRKALPEFDELVTYGDQLIGQMVAERLEDDILNTRNRASIYIKEYKDHEKEMLELRERIKHQLEKDDQLNKYQIQEIITESMHIIQAKEKAKDDPGTNSTK